MKLWDLINDIRYGKQHVFKKSHYADDVVKLYVPFVVNRALSFHSDAVLLVNEINVRPWVTRIGQFAFLLNIIRPNKRFEKWIKQQDDDDLEVVKQLYQCNDRKASEIIKLLTEQQLDHLRAKLQKGGRQ